MLAEPALVSLLSSGQCRSPYGSHVVGEGLLQDRMTGATVVHCPRGHFIPSACLRSVRFQLLDLPAGKEHHGFWEGFEMKNCRRCFPSPNRSTDVKEYTKLPLGGSNPFEVLAVQYSEIPTWEVNRQVQ